MALPSYDQAIALRPQNFWVYSQKGLILEQLGNYSLAIACYQTALDLSPKQDALIYQQACCYAELNQTNWAITCLEKAITISPLKYLALANEDLVWQNYTSKFGFQSLIATNQQKYQNLTQENNDSETMNQASDS